MATVTLLDAQGWRSGMWAEAYGLVKCEGCGELIIGTRDACKHCVRGKTPGSAEAAAT
jgi:hypothetical protein